MRQLALLVTAAMASTLFPTTPARALGFESEEMNTLIAEQRTEDLKNSIDHAIGIYVTNRGQKLFATDLQKILYLNGLALNEITIPEFSWEAAEPIFSDNLPAKVRKEQGSFSAIRDVLKKWLMNLDFNNPRPRVTLKNLGYKARFTRLSIRTDVAAQRAAGINDGVGLVLEAEAPEIQFSVEQTRAIDLANDYLGQFGIDALNLKLAKSSVPLRVQVPILIQTDMRNGLNIQAMGMKTNLQEVKTRLGFARPLVFPSVEIRINSHVLGQLNPQAIEDEILRQQEGLTRAMLAWAKDFVEKQVPTRINAKLAEFSAKGLDDVNAMIPPGAPRSTPSEDRFRWGIGIEEATINQNYLYVGLKGFVRDPRKVRQSPIQDAPDVLLMLKDVDPRSYDLALTINQTFVNRMLQLSFERGYFDKIPFGKTPDDFIALAAPPELHADGVTDHTRAKLRLRIKHYVKGLSSLVVTTPMEITFDVRVRLNRKANGDAQMMMDGIDVESAEVEDRFIRIDWFRAQVMEKVHAELSAKNDQFMASPRPLMERLPLPPEVFGVPIKLKDIRTESSGHLVLYMEYGTLPQN